jgi:hypothetical protein
MTIAGIELALKIAFDLASAHLKKAREIRRYDAESCREYLQAAMESMNGLENARVELLSDAKWLETKDDFEKARKILAQKLDLFFDQRTLYPILSDATEGIEHCTQELERNTDGFFGRRLPSGRLRSELITAARWELTALTSYMGELRSAWAKEGMTTPGIYGLMQLQDMLMKASPESIRVYASEELDARRGALDEWRSRVARLGNDLRSAFR